MWSSEQLVPLFIGGGSAHMRFETIATTITARVSLDTNSIVIVKHRNYFSLLSYKNNTSYVFSWIYQMEIKAPACVLLSEEAECFGISNSSTMNCLDQDICAIMNS